MSGSLIEMLSSQLAGGDTLSQLSRAIGADEGATSKALAGAMPMLLGGLANNASDGNGAASLASALDRDHDGSVLDDVAGFLQGGGRGVNGDGILSHVFGGRKPAVEKSISQSSGLSGSQVSQLLQLAAPLVMGFLGKQKRSQGLDAGALASMLGGAKDEMSRTKPNAMDAVTRLLDSDGDGSVMDEVADLGSSLLGGFLKRR